MVFKDRIDAGQQLAEQLNEYRKREETVVVGLPRGGVPVAAIVARALGLPLDITCPRKIGAPGNPEYAIGAITETGEGILNQEVITWLDIPEEYLQTTIEEEKKEAQHRLELYRGGLPPRNLKGKCVILVDDGLATGSTMRAAISSIKGEGASTIIVAVPVAPPDTLDRIKTEVDVTICLEAPPYFHAVGQFYEIFGQTSDDEVIDWMNKTK